MTDQLAADGVPLSQNPGQTRRAPPWSASALRLSALLSSDWAVRLVQAGLLAWLVMSFVAQMNVGLADNGDYSRFMSTITSGPVGMQNWPDAGTQASNLRFFNYWLPYWKLDWPLHWSPTTVVLLWLPGALFSSVVFARDILWMPLLGLPIKLALVALVLLLLVWIETRARRQRLLLTIVLAGPLVLSLSTTDYVVLINTFYREAGTLVYLLMFMASVLYLNARPTSAARWWLCLAAAVLLTLAKASNIYWPLIAVPFLMWRSVSHFTWPGLLARAAAGVALIAVLIIGGQRLLADATNPVTSYDNFFNSALLVSRHPADHLQRLGMPESLPCIGLSVYVGFGHDCYLRYQGRMRLSNSLSVMFFEPMVVVYQLQLGLDNLADQSYEWHGIYSVTDPRASTVPAVAGPFDQRYWGVRSNLPLNFWSWLRFNTFPHGWLAAAALALFAALAWVGSRQAGPGRDLALVCLIAVVACIFDIQVQTVGEGTQDLIRHLFLSNMLFDLAGMAAVGSVLCRLTARPWLPPQTAAEGRAA
jgi:hypothetical protein